MFETNLVVYRKVSSQVNRTCLYYLAGARQIHLDIVTMENWIVEVKTGKSRIGLRQMEIHESKGRRKIQRSLCRFCQQSFDWLGWPE